METLIIDRAEHLTGNAYRHLNESGLRLESCGLMCCLGSYGKACGATIHQLNGFGNLTSLVNLMPGVFLNEDINWLRTPVAEKDRILAHNFTVQDALISANDDYKAHPSRREGRIKKLFKKYGNIEVQFVGDRGKATAAARKVGQG